MAHESVTRCLGLVNQFNPLSIAPGSLAKADNCVILRENIIEDRRGYNLNAALASNIKQVMQFGGKVLAHQGTTISYGLSGSFSSYAGSYSEPSSSKIRYAEANSNLYFTTSLGVKVFTDVVGTTARSAGVPRCLDPSYALNVAASGFLATAYQCAYRVVIKRTDANSNVFRGYPSQRLWVTNTSGTGKNVDLTIYLPSEAQANDVIEVYRTSQVSGTSSDSSGDEMGLVYQYTLTSGDISTGYISFTDSIVDSLRGATIYTAPSQQGIAQANDRPPLCKDVALYRSNFMFYANTSTKQRLYFALVGTSGLSGRTITLGGVTYNFGATEIVSGGGSPQAKVSATGTLSIDIDETARSLVRVINRYASNTTIYAYYLTGADDLPGKIMIEERGIGASAYTIQAGDTTISAMFFPAPPVGTTNSASTSSNTVQRNGLYYSKYQEVEHVPTLNYLSVGPANKEILRIIPLRESLVVIKEEGVYRVTGDSVQNFSVVPIDLTVFCKSADSVAVVSNQVFMISNQGIVAISESSIEVKSREIEPMIKKILAKGNISTLCYGAGYETDRHYMISTITDQTDSVANQTLVYNIFTKTWVRWTFAFISAVVEPTSDRLYFAKDSDSNIYAERKDNTFTDYADEDISITISAISGNYITFSSSTQPEEGWNISQAGTEIPIDSFTTLATGEYQALVDSSPPAAWTTGAATLLPSVGMEVKWNPWTASQPGLMKQARAVKILTDSTEGENSASYLQATFTSNFDNEEEFVDLSQPGFGWGGPWGTMPWGGGSDSFGYSTWVPRNKQYCTRINLGVIHKNSREKCSIAGYAIDFEVVSDRIGT